MTADSPVESASTASSDRSASDRRPGSLKSGETSDNAIGRSAGVTAVAGPVYAELNLETKAMHKVAFLMAPLLVTGYMAL